MTLPTLPTIDNPTPDVSSRYGAPMGRSVATPSGDCLTVRPVALDSGGYDAGGAYWGIGKPLYYVADEHGNGTFARYGRGDVLAKVMAAYGDENTTVAWHVPGAVDDAMVGEMFDAYVTAALWSECDDEGEPLDGDHGPDDVHPDTLASMRADCAAFLVAHFAVLAALPNAGPSQWGHDLWLTRNRHGVGFWGRGYGPDGDTLSDAAHAMGSVDLWVGDDGMIHG
jgi:hypothetical protein